MKYIFTSRGLVSQRGEMLQLSLIVLSVMGLSLFVIWGKYIETYLGNVHGAYARLKKIMTFIIINSLYHVFMIKTITTFLVHMNVSDIISVAFLKRRVIFVHLFPHTIREIVYT